MKQNKRQEKIPLKNYPLHIWVFLFSSVEFFEKSDMNSSKY